MQLTWDDLGARALARQFPDISEMDAADPGAVAVVLDQIGPIQAQTARSPYVALGARLPGVRLETITAAYADHRIVRGSNIRGTVHTSTPDDNALLDAVTRIGQRAIWNRTMRLADTTLEQLWTSIETFAAEWRTPAELAEHVIEWIAANDPAATPRVDATLGRSMCFGSGALIRRPAKGDAWEGQGAPVYLTASEVLGDGSVRSSLHADPERAVELAVRRHLRAHGPASRHDIAWWSGIGLRPIDAALERFGAELDTATGPDGRVYHDVPDAPEPRELAGVRLLPEFDALLCGYDPPARERFVDAAHYRRLWSQDNGLILAPLLVDGRLTGWWRLARQGRKRSLEVHWFSGTRRPRKAELDQPVARLEAAYGVDVSELTLSRE